MLDDRAGLGRGRAKGSAAERLMASAPASLSSLGDREIVLVARTAAEARRTQLALVAFYILCPDNETMPEQNAKRVARRPGT